MPSIVHERREQLEAEGEYVVLANVTSGWFAVFESTLSRRREVATGQGRPGPNLVVYRTLNEASDPRDHYVVPHRFFNELLGDDNVAASKIKSSRRWNLTLRENRLKVTNRQGHIDVAEFFRAPLIGEISAAPPELALSKPSLQVQSVSALEGISRELMRTARSRSAALREVAIKTSRGICEACEVDFSNLLFGPWCTSAAGSSQESAVRRSRGSSHETGRPGGRLRELPFDCPRGPRSSDARS